MTINNDYYALQDPILLIKISMGTRKNFPKIIDNLGTRSVKGSIALALRTSSVYSSACFISNTAQQFSMKFGFRVFFEFNFDRYNKIHIRIQNETYSFYEKKKQL
jgi:hypothetical protein